MAVLQNEVCTKDFFSRHDFSHEKCSEMFSEFFEPLFCGSEKVPAKFPPSFPHHFPPQPLIFFSLPFWKTARKTTKKARISSACRTPQSLGKEGQNAQIRKEFLEKEKGKENQKGKEKKIREKRCCQGIFTHTPRIGSENVLPNVACILKNRSTAAPFQNIS